MTRTGAAAGSSASTIVIERNEASGMETSSRNSEVIHAGLYYGRDSLKTKLCIRGREMLYEYCARRAIAHRQTGKWIVAQTAAEWAACERMHALARALGNLPTRPLSRAEARRREPDVRAAAGVLESTRTGIVDSHGLMASLQADFEELGGDVAFRSTVTRIEALGGNTDSSNSNGSSSNGSGSSGGGGQGEGEAGKGRSGGGDEGSGEGRSGSGDEGGGGGGAGGAGGSGGYRITVRDRASGHETAITAATLVNAAGLGACAISNMLLPPARHRTPHFAKGTYYSYAAPAPRPTTLIYPAPRPTLGGLGTHLTLDLHGRVRFGPDVEWVDDPADLMPRADGGERLARAVAEIREYLPGVRADALAPDYCGIRPKLARGAGAVAGAVVSGGDGNSSSRSSSSSSSSFQDFVIQKEDGFEGFINLLGIESPGLTSSLAIAEMVNELLYR